MIDISKSNVTSGIVWNTLEKLSVKITQFIIGIILARLLLPEDYGLIGMIAIFIAISQTFVDSGMGSGLIQKQNRSTLDYSTVFVFNFIVSSTFYFLLFISAPYIADFYNTPELKLITRIVGINLIINSFALVQRSIIMIALDFKKLAKINIISVILSGIIAVYFAYSGYGVWSLVIQTLISSITSTILLWYFSKWKPSVVFSNKSFKDLFGFGSKLLLAGIYAKTLQNIYNISIGKKYSADDLGFYTQGKQLAEVSSGTISSILQQVTFPVLSSLQADKEKMILVYKRLIKMTAFLIFPVMITLAVLSNPLIELLLGEKWLRTIPLLQWMCFARIFYPLSILNLNILKANGRSDLFLKVDILKAPIIILALIITIPISVEAIVIGQVISTFISYLINSFYSRKLYGYGAISQFKDIWLMIISSVITGLITYFIIIIINSLVLKLVIGFGVSIIIYFLISNLFKIQEIQEIKSLFLKKH